MQLLLITRFQAAGVRAIRMPPARFIETASSDGFVESHNFDGKVKSFIYEAHAFCGMRRT
ncbi:MAG: hypothetical protein U9N45_03835 [Gemmatimonadota bacterium]|nr:hypothetical protein [Gemmatimonadota bacterium]